MNGKLIICLTVFITSTCISCGYRDSEQSGKEPDVLFYLTTPNQSAKFTKQNDDALKPEEIDATTIEIFVNKSFQEMDGFGFTLTGGSAFLINNLNEKTKSDLLNELFRWDADNIGVSYLRISMGASDLDAEVFSYDDLPKGVTDINLDKFTLDPDRKFLIPVLKDIIAVNPKIKIMASPWSPPPWMKSNNSSKGGSLKPEYYASYAKYFVKYIEGMQKEGIRIDAVTVQNEPLHPGNNPSLLMQAEEEAAFIKGYLGPAFETSNIKTKIIIYDHNADRIDYPIDIYKDLEANKYIDGSAFHLYGGTINELSKVHDAYPDKNLYFTEQWIGAPGDFANDLKWHIENLIIGAPRNWCKTVLEWNLAGDQNQEPHTPGGCTKCLGALTINGETITRNPAYYIIAHAAKFVRPGSVRIESSVPDGLPNVAFQTPDKKVVLIVLNNSQSDKDFNIKSEDKIFSSTLVKGAAGTYVW
jgi:glucosylceramidase